MPARVLAAVCGDHGLALDVRQRAAAPAIPPGMTAALTGRAIDCTVVGPGGGVPGHQVHPFQVDAGEVGHLDGHPGGEAGQSQESGCRRRSG